MAKNIKAGSAFVEIGIRNRIAAGAKAVQADLRKLSSKLTGQGKSLMKIGGMLAGAVGAPLAVAIRAGSQMQETMGKFNTVFGEAAGEVQAWGATTATAMGVSEQSMMSMLSGMQDLLVPMGMLPDQATGISKTLSALAVDLGSFNNMDPAQVMGDLQAAMTGSGEVMKKYGVILSATAVNQELLNQNLDPKTATEAQKAQARMNIIMRGTTAAQGDAVRTSGSFANQMKALKATFMDVAAAVGGELLDDLAGMMRIVNAGVSAVKNFVKENGQLVRVVGMVLIGVGGLGVALMTIGGVLVGAGMAFSVLASVIGVLMSPVALAIGGIVALGFAIHKYTTLGADAVDWLKSRFQPLVDSVMTAIGGIMAALKAGDLETAWTLVSDMMELVWLDMTEGIRTAWHSMLDFILNTGSTIASAIGQVFQGLAKVLQGMLGTYKGIYNTIYNGVLEMGGNLTGVRTIGGPVDGFSANFGGAEQVAQTGINAISDFGEGMQQEADGQKEERRERREQQKKERQQRMDELKSSIDADAEAAKATAEAGAKAGEKTGEKSGAAGDISANVKVEGANIAAKRAGPSGTFSAFAAGIMGATPPVQTVSDNELRKLQRENNKTQREMNKHLKKLDNEARFAG